MRIVFMGIGSYATQLADQFVYLGLDHLVTYLKPNRKAQEALSAKRADAKTDPGELQDMTDQFTWDTRIFDERRKSLSYVCEVPVIIEHRLFELSKTIQTQLK